MRSGGVLTDGVGLTGHGDCRMEVRPSLAMVQLHLLALFTAGVVMSSWVWTSSTVDTWIRFIKRSVPAFLFFVQYLCLDKKNSFSQFVILGLLIKMMMNRSK